MAHVEFTASITIDLSVREMAHSNLSLKLVCPVPLFERSGNRNMTSFTFEFVS